MQTALMENESSSVHRVNPMLFRLRTASAAILLMATAATAHAGERSADAATLRPGGWAPIARTDPRYLSFNIEMAEITGGEFWAPYDDPQQRRYAPRKPVDLTDPRLLQLARGLSPAILRVSGTWANSTYVSLPGEAAGESPPQGFGQVLRPERWRDLVAFANAADLSLLLSFPASQGTRDALGHWQPEQADRLVDLTLRYGGKIAAVEFINEPNLPGLGKLPAGYSATDYARDLATFRAFAARRLPGVPVLGHSTSGRGGDLPADALFAASTGLIDAVSYHFYGALSPRCAEYGNQVSATEALSEEWLARTDVDYRFYADLRDRHAQGLPIWLTETAQSACGGNAWAATFRDSFRFVDQLGRLARHGVRVVAHNTLDAGDYAMLDHRSLAPRPNYWMAWWWQRSMGPQVLAPPAHSHLYAHCLRGSQGGVAVVAIVPGDEAVRLTFDRPAIVRTFSATSLDASDVRMNGRRFNGDPTAAPATGTRVASGRAIRLAPRSISYLTLPDADNPACRSADDAS